jgi:hypothetical protein
MGARHRGIRLHPRDGGVHEIDEIHVRELGREASGRDAGHVQKAIRQLREPIDFALRLGQPFGVRRAGQRLLEDVELELERVQGRAQLVPRDGDEDVAKAHALLGLEEKALPLGFGSLPCADISRAISPRRRPPWASFTGETESDTGIRRPPSKIGPFRNGRRARPCERD